MRRTVCTSPALSGLRASSLALACALLCCAGTVSGAQRPDVAAEHAFRRVVAALGGQHALDRTRALSALGAVDLLGGFPGRYELTIEFPFRSRVDWDIKYIAGTRVVTERAGWMSNGHVRDLSQDEFQRYRDRAHLLQLLSAYRPVEVLACDDCPAPRERRPMPLRRLAMQARDARQAELVIDARGVPSAARFRVDYEDGARWVTVSYADFRRVGDLRLPFQIEDESPDLPMSVRIESYTVNPVPVAGRFDRPDAARLAEPYELTLATIPRRVYKEELAQVSEGHNEGWRRFWGVPYGPSETWLVDLVVGERHGRSVHLVSESVRSYRGNQLVDAQTFSDEALAAMVRTPVTRFAPQDHLFAIRHPFVRPQAAAIDRQEFVVEAVAPDGQHLAATLSVPVDRYEQRHSLLFPVRGNFVVREGHEFYELSHTYEWSQHFAYDIACLGADFELAENDGRRNEDYVAFGRCAVVAPADGTVVFARNDVPDDLTGLGYLARDNGLWAIGGNMIVVDHGEGEYSLFAHLHQGSVQVAAGQRVTRGQIIGRLGASGSPGFPHLHYQLQTSPGLFDGDGLPSRFENVYTVEPERIPVPMPRRGYFLRAE